MQIFGDPIIPFVPFYKIETTEDITHTKANSIVCFPYDKNMMSYCMKNGIGYCVYVEDSIQAVIANALQASYMIVPKSKCTDIQHIAENYLFDTKVLVDIEEELQMQELIDHGIDGVIYTKVAIEAPK